MSIIKIGLVAAMTALLVSGCSAASVRGKPALSPQECHSDWLVERRARDQDAAHDAVDLEKLINAFLRILAGFSTATDVADARYRDCLSRVGVQDATSFAQTWRVGRPNEPMLGYQAPLRPAHCPRGAGVLYGGAGYCVGR